MSVVAAVLLACAVALAFPSQPAVRAAKPSGLSGSPEMWGRSVGATARPSSPQRLSRSAVMRGSCLLAGVGIAVAMGGWWGIGAGAAVAVVGPRILSRFESRGVRERREALGRQAADCADLLAACLASGATLSSSVQAVAHALGPPIEQPLTSLLAALNLGADPVRAWQELGMEPGLAPLARAAARSSDSGAPLAQLLPGIADDLRRESRLEAEAAARAAGVKAVAPLAACFLPAFLLLGVIPVVVSIALPFISEGMLG